MIGLKKFLRDNPYPQLISARNERAIRETLPVMIRAIEDAYMFACEVFQSGNERLQDRAMAWATDTRELRASFEDPPVTDLTAQPPDKSTAAALRGRE